MEYIYTAMLIHKAGGKVEEATVKKVLEAAGVQVDDARVKALVASLEGVNIDEAIEKAAVAPVAIVADRVVVANLETPTLLLTNLTVIPGTSFLVIPRKNPEVLPVTD